MIVPLLLLPSTSVQPRLIPQTSVRPLTTLSSPAYREQTISAHLILSTAIVVIYPNRRHSYCNHFEFRLTNHYLRIITPGTSVSNVLFSFRPLYSQHGPQKLRFSSATNKIGVSATNPFFGHLRAARSIADDVNVSPFAHRFHFTRTKLM